YAPDQDFASPEREGNVIYLEKELPFAMEKVWEEVFQDFGAVANFSPEFVGSGYLSGSSLAVGAERYCHSKKDGSEGVHERVVFVDSEGDRREVQFQIVEALGVPINTEKTFGTSQLVRLDDHRTLFRIRFVFSTNPSFIALFARGQIRGQLNDMTLGMEHYLATGQTVTAENFDDIKAALASN
ncbi:MAG: hypothetical protein AAFU79_23060, partial [Myxococcota bacterium]